MKKKKLNKLNNQEEFIRVYYSEIQQDMRWRKEVEFKLITFMLTFDTIIGGAISIILNLNDIPSLSKLWVCIFVSILMVLLTIVIVHKIKQEHKIYNELSKSIKNVWIHEKITTMKILPNNWEKYGTGKGYLFTIRITWAITIIISLSILLAAALIHLSN